MAEPRAAEPAAGIAVVGLACRFPGASGPDAFWANLRAGVESISTFTAEELAASGVPREVREDPAYVPARGILDGVELFDAAFFGFTPREAEAMDPQHRLFLECAWEALEDAGCDPSRSTGPIGVYAGASSNAYAHSQLGHALDPAADRLPLAIGNEKDYLATRASHKLDLKGPSLTVQTACSTSLVAVHLACQGLLNGECDLALAGGASVILPQQSGYLYQDGGIASPDGHCRAFDAAAQGTVGGNGVGVVALKRLAEALADGDRVYAVIRGSAINNDGAGKVGFTAPGIAGQAAVIAEAQAVAGVPPETIGCVEAHGTGTPLGDPVEVAALTQAFGAGTGRTGFCALGSVKTNIGHLDAAAGIAGLLKAVLCLWHGEVPPSLHFRRPNPAIDFAASPFFVNAGLRPWPRGESPRRAGVSSFGIGGTNAHAVLEEAPEAPPAGPARPRHLLVLSARTAPALDAATAALAGHLRRHPDLPAADVAATLQLGRRAFEHRRALVAGDTAEAAAALEAPAPGRVRTGRAPGGSRPVVFLLPGQGAQHPGMGRGLYEHEPAFRDEVDRCSELLRPHLGLDLRALLYPEGAEGETDGRLDDTALAQPALFVVEHALARLWASWGVRPDALLGHSLGELTAAALAGVFTLPDALALVALRGKLVAALPRGAMLAVPLAEAELAPRLPADLALAAVNAPALCTVAGPIAAVVALAAELGRRGVACRRLPVSHAFHSPLVEPALAPFREAVAAVERRPPAIPWLSNVTGDWITAEQATDPGSWAGHLRRTVRFGDAVRRLLAPPEAAFVEVGPGGGLGVLVRRQAGRGGERTVVASLTAAGCAARDSAPTLAALGALWCAGVPVDWEGVQAGQGRRRVGLPTYPFERRRFWIEPRRPGEGGAAPPGKRPDPGAWTYLPGWRRTPPPELLAPGEPDDGAPWLLLADGEGLAAQLAGRLAARGRGAVLVEPGSAFERLGAGRYAVAPGAGPDYDALLADLAARGEAPARVVHLWAVGPPGDAVARGFGSLLLLAQAWSRRGWDRPLRLGVVSTGLWEVAGGEALHPEKAALLGPVRVLPQERPGTTCRSIDVDALPLRRADAADLLLAELGSGAADPVVALRGAHRWAPSWEPVRLDPARGAARLRERGVYLITGGLGGMGLAIAERLAAVARARLVLVGRSAPEEAWEEWLAGQGDAGDPLIQRLAALRAAGADVMVARADVADPERMAAVVERARRGFGCIHGVVHAAGVGEGGLAELTTPAAAAAVLAPKVAGARVLESLFAGAGLDLCVLCSSLGTLLGGAGQVAYTAANAFLDAFASANALAGTTTVAVGWDTWKEVGMAAAEAARSGPTEFWRRRLEAAIAPAEGTEVLLRALGAGVPRVVVSTVDLAAVLAGARPLDLASRLAEPAPGAAPASPSRPAPGREHAAPGTEIERRLAAAVEEVLGFERVGLHDDFFELGGHSLAALGLLSRIERGFGVRLPLASLLERPTVERLARLIADRREGLDAPRVER